MYKHFNTDYTGYEICTPENVTATAAGLFGLNTSIRTGIVWFTNADDNYANGTLGNAQPQTERQTPNLMYFPMIPQGTTKKDRLGDKVRLRFFNNSHRLRINWPGITSVDNNDGAQLDIAQAYLDSVNAVSLYVYEFVIRCRSEASITPAAAHDTYPVVETSLAVTAQRLMSRFANLIPNSPVGSGSIATPSDPNEPFSTAIDPEDMWGTKQSKSEIPTDILNQRAGLFPEGLQIIKVHKIKAPRRRLFATQDNSTDSTTTHNQFGFKQMSRFIKCGVKKRMNTTVHFKDDGTRIPRNGFFYGQMLYINNPLDAAEGLLPTVQFQDGDIRMSWTD